MKYADNEAALEVIEREAEAGMAGAQTRTQLPLFLFPLIGYFLISHLALPAWVGVLIAIGLVVVAASFLATIDRSHIDTAARKAVARYRNEQKQHKACDQVQQDAAKGQLEIKETCLALLTILGIPLVFSLLTGRK